MICLATLALPLAAIAQKAPTLEPGQKAFEAQRRREPKVQPKLQTAEQNKAVVRQVFDDLFTRGRYDLIDKVYSRDCVVHYKNRLYKLEESVSEGKGWRSAAPDLQMIAEQMKVEGNLVDVSWTAKGTHTGRGNGLTKPTGKHILVHGNSRFRVVNGKIAEVWNNYDRNEVFRQLGVSPTMGCFYEETEGLRLALSRLFYGPLSAQPQQ